MRLKLFLIFYLFTGFVGALLWLKGWKEDNGKFTIGSFVIAFITLCSGYIGFTASLIVDVLYNEAKLGGFLSKYLEWRQ